MKSINEVCITVIVISYDYAAFTQTLMLYNLLSAN